PVRGDESRWRWRNGHHRDRVDGFCAGSDCGARHRRARLPCLAHRADAGAQEKLMTFREASTRALVIAAIPLMAGGAAAAADHRIALQVQSKSWIPSSAFDVEQFDSQCSAVGIELVAPASPLPVAATAVVTYVETRGAGFSRF